MGKKDNLHSITFDKDRIRRIGIEEAVLSEPKSNDQIVAILRDAINESRRLLMTRLTKDQFMKLPEELASALDYCAQSRTGIMGELPTAVTSPRIALLSAGTSDAGPVAEAQRVLAYSGYSTHEFADVGVAGLWRLLEHEARLRDMDILIVFAGMDAALPSVVAGLVPGFVIAVPTSVGYGVAKEGRAALDATLASCAPGVTVVNIDNGYGAACAAIRFANACRRVTAQEDY